MIGISDFDDEEVIKNFFKDSFDGWVWVETSLLLFHPLILKSLLY